MHGAKAQAVLERDFFGHRLGGESRGHTPDYALVRTQGETVGRESYAVGWKEDSRAHLPLQACTIAAVVFVVMGHEHALDVPLSQESPHEAPLVWGPRIDDRGA